MFFAGYWYYVLLWLYITATPPLYWLGIGSEIKRGRGWV